MQIVPPPPHSPTSVMHSPVVSACRQGVVNIVLVEAVLLRQMRYCLQHLPRLSLQRGHRVVGSYEDYILRYLITCWTLPLVMHSKAERCHRFKSSKLVHGRSLLLLLLLLLLIPGHNDPGRRTTKEPVDASP